MSVPAMRMELVPIGVSDIDRAKAFYLRAGFDLTVDVQPMPGMRVIQFTPPGSSCSIVFGEGMEGISTMQAGVLRGIHLVVDDLDAARTALLEREVEVAGPWDVGGVRYAAFEDPDRNQWLLQQWPAR
jgi:catechol 2,3-dioxygenase-like lactoylglutathione lyase family enzyme